MSRPLASRGWRLAVPSLRGCSLPWDHATSTYYLEDSSYVVEGQERCFPCLKLSHTSVEWSLWFELGSDPKHFDAAFTSKVGYRGWQSSGDI